MFELVIRRITITEIAENLEISVDSMKTVVKSCLKFTMVSTNRVAHFLNTNKQDLFQSTLFEAL